MAHVTKSPTSFCERCKNKEPLTSYQLPRSQFASLHRQIASQEQTDYYGGNTATHLCVYPRPAPPADFTMGTYVESDDRVTINADGIEIGKRIYKNTC